jgi:hypothetical protein
MSLFEAAGLPDPSPVMAATRWRDNSEMVLDARKLDYINEDSFTLDPTFQDGTWWKHWRPESLVTNSLDPANGADLCFDFRRAPFPDETFDAITYDPPYVSKGGRDTSTMQDHQRRYGIGDAPKSPRELQELINAGASEMTRVLKSGGTLFVKCQDYISSGKYWWGTDLTRLHVGREHPNMSFEDRFYFLNNGSAQPDRDKKCPTCKGTGDPTHEGLLMEPPASQCGTCEGEGRVESRQQHARVNVSTLFVFKKNSRKGSK